MAGNKSLWKLTAWPLLDCEVVLIHVIGGTTPTSTMGTTASPSPSTSSSGVVVERPTEASTTTLVTSGHSLRIQLEDEIRDCKEI